MNKSQELLTSVVYGYKTTGSATELKLSFLPKTTWLEQLALSLVAASVCIFLGELLS